MNKEEFKSKKKILNSNIEELKNEMIKLEKEYIESNAKYPIGSKVCITTNESKRYAYVKDYRINSLDNIEPLFNKVKKDGTMSEMGLYVSLTNATIELVKE
jgi:hypothetical protein|nr:MAG TPA: hypothetical protein [Caudoviricetes sp.]